ncbi:MAG: hypothetical protein VCE12_02220 [Candidatus Latescibacterota bacterium]
MSLSGEAKRCGLNWLLGQLEPMALAANLSGDTHVGDTVRAVLLRLAEVYPRYPLYTVHCDYAAYVCGSQGLGPGGRRNTPAARQDSCP